MLESKALIQSSGKGRILKCMTSNVLVDSGISPVWCLDIFFATVHKKLIIKNVSLLVNTVSPSDAKTHDEQSYNRTFFSKKISFHSEFFCS